MDDKIIKEKFGGCYTANENTCKMGIDFRITRFIAKRFKNKIVLEKCTGAGFTTISLTKVAAHVYSVEINKKHQKQAVENVDKAGLREKVTFLLGDVIKMNFLNNPPGIQAAFLDPDWADFELNHIYKFIDSNTIPPADKLFETIWRITKNIALILPPFIEVSEFTKLPSHELQRIYFADQLVLYCLYFGALVNVIG